MFTIGEFARLGSVTVRTLRHYDEIGLLHPQEVDSTTGYRFYVAGQLATLNRVAALQRLGFSLRDIEALLGSITVDQMRGMLALRRSQVQDELATQQAALREIESRLRAIEREGTMPDFDITVKTLPAVHFAAVSSLVPGFGPENTLEPLTAAAAQLQAALTDSGVKPTGFWFICYERVANDELLAYFCLPVPDNVTSIAAPAQVFELDRVQTALSVVREIDDLDGYSNIYQDIAIWAENNGYVLVGDGRDLSLDGNGAGSGMVMDTQWPVRLPADTVPDVTPRPVG